jgi:hypothetical protein
MRLVTAASGRTTLGGWAKRFLCLLGEASAMLERCLEVLEDAGEDVVGESV